MRSLRNSDLLLLTLVLLIILGVCLIIFMVRIVTLASFSLDDSEIIMQADAEDLTAGLRALTDGLDYGRFKQNIQILASFGDRTQGTQGYANAERWLQQQLENAGYTVERHTYVYEDQSRENIYATKVGTLLPDRMFILSAHLDGRGDGGAANDDASGISLVLEVARALAQGSVESEISIRFIFWNNEETGLDGSRAYVQDRLTLQGIESPRDSGLYPEPFWLGIIQYDQILFDHGNPPQAAQIAGADIDIEYQTDSVFVEQSSALAAALQRHAVNLTTDYPVEIGSNMRNTDSQSFQDFTAAVSVRDNTRDEIGNGSHPHWHQASDRYEIYSEADFQLGFDTLQMTLGTVADLARVRSSGN